MPKRLSKKFYLEPTTDVAKKLLGCRLVHEVDGERLSGRIIETEAYLGTDDRAAHSFGGRQTDRLRSMYLEGGHAYVYFIYGMHFCFNVVTLKAGIAQAVLVRAIEPVEGIEFMKKNRGISVKERDLANGPGKLCKALRIDRACDGLSLIKSKLFIEKDLQFDDASIIAGPRIGVDYAGEAAAWPLRFTIQKNAKSLL